MGRQPYGPSGDWSTPGSPSAGVTAGKSGAGGAIWTDSVTTIQVTELIGILYQQENLSELITGWPSDCAAWGLCFSIFSRAALMPLRTFSPFLVFLRMPCLRRKVVLVRPSSKLGVSASCFRWINNSQQFCVSFVHIDNLIEDHPT